MQYKEEQPFIFGLQWHHLKGGWKTTIHLNAFGTPTAKLIRDTGIVDDGIYMGCITIHYLLEVAGLVEYPDEIINEEQILRNIEGANTHKDHNRPGMTALTYWGQRYNETSRMWYLYSDNIGNVVPYLVRASNWAQNFVDFTGFKFSDNILAVFNMTYVILYTHRHMVYVFGSSIITTFYSFLSSDRYFSQ